jgi:hypothetical protein
MRRAAALLAVVALMALPAGVMADWSDNFDGYADGTKLDNIGGWAGWDNVPAAAGTVSSLQSLSAPHSISVSNDLGVDAVHPFSGYTSGAWTFTANQYIPSGLDSLTYFILNSQYNHGGPYQWAIEMHMDPSNGMVNEQIRDDTGTMATPIVYDQWVEIRVDFDLDANTVDAYYNGVQIVTGTWATASYPARNFENVDLYAPHNGTVYYDDLSLTPEPTSLLLLGLGGLLLRRRR